MSEIISEIIGEESILVDFCYEIVNGMCGMQRNVVLRLVDLMQNKRSKIQAVIGMSQEHFILKTHRHFIRSRLKVHCFGISHSFRRNPKRGFSSISILGGKIQCSFTGERRTVFQNTLITHGIYQWKIKMDYADGNKKQKIFCIGVSKSDHIDRCHGELLGEVPETHAFQFRWSKGECTYGSFRGGKRTSEIYSLDRNLTLNGTVIIIEVDAGKFIIRCFVGGEKIYDYFRDLPIYLGASALAGMSFTALYFRRSSSLLT